MKAPIAKLQTSATAVRHPARAVQVDNADWRREQFIQFPARDLMLLRKVLRSSGDPEHRALAAEVIAYASNKQAVVDDLVRAARDPSSGVSNNAVRALALIAAYSQRNPKAHLEVPWTTFIDLLNSIVWTDRNKSSFALMQLSESRDPRLLKALKAKALPALLEMARWKSRRHAVPSFVILGRIRALSDESIFKAWENGTRETVLDLFEKERP